MSATRASSIDGSFGRIVDLRRRCWWFRLRNVQELDGPMARISASGKATSAEEIEGTPFEIGPESLRGPSVRVVVVRLNALSSQMDEVAPEEGEEYGSDLVYVSSSVFRFVYI